jgi:hypothetical protein
MINGTSGVFAPDMNPNSENYEISPGKATWLSRGFQGFV